MKLPSVYTDLCCQQVFENTSAGLNSRCRSVVNSASCDLQLPLTVPAPSGSRSRSATYDVRFTG